ncbi:hypothetical protein ACO1O0_008824 [Amphichorda felina]
MRSLSTVLSIAGATAFAKQGASSLIQRTEELELRIMPLGASIVNGVGSDPDHNGFRGPLRSALRFNGFPVDMVGFNKDGTIEDNDNEGTPGAIIDETPEHFDRSSNFKPNVVVINLGTNDANRDIDIAGGKQRMSDLLAHIWDAPDMAGACIFLSTLIPSGLDNGIRNGPTLNGYYRELVGELRDQHCIYLADMDPAEGDAHDWIRPDLNDDGIHPNVEGHRKMAYVFWQAILQAYNDGRIQPPVPMEEPNNNMGDGGSCCDDPALPVQPGTTPIGPN